MLPVWFWLGCCLIWCFWCLLRLAVGFEFACVVVYVLFNYVNSVELFSLVLLAG